MQARGRGAAGKVAVFGLLKRGGKVVTAIEPNARTEALLSIIEEKVTLDSIVYTDTFKAYNALGVTTFHGQAKSHTTELKTFGIKPNDIFDDSMGSKPTISTGLSRSANGASVEETIKTYTNSLSTGIPSQNTNP
jgi:transposase-like protein